MTCYQRGDIVWYWSKQGGKKLREKAVFVGHDKMGFPRRDCLLAVPLGKKRKNKKRFVHTFRWPLELIKPVAR